MSETPDPSWADRIFEALGVTADDIGDMLSAPPRILGDIPQAPPAPLTEPFAPVRCPSCNTAPERPVAGGWECACGGLLLRQVPPIHTKHS